MPAVTGNSLIEYVVEEATNQKVFQDGLSKMGYLSLSVHPQKAKKFKPVPKEHVVQLINNKNIFAPHYGKDLFIVPAYYDAAGKPLHAAGTETPEQWYVIWTSGVNWRQNYMQASKFQDKNGFKEGAAIGLNMLQVDEEEPKHPTAKK